MKFIFAIFIDLCSIDSFIDDQELSDPAPQRPSYIFIQNLFKISFQPDTEEDAVYSLLARVDEKYCI